MRRASALIRWIIDHRHACSDAQMWLVAFSMYRSAPSVFEGKRTALQVANHWSGIPMLTLDNIARKIIWSPNQALTPHSEGYEACGGLVLEVKAQELPQNWAFWKAASMEGYGKDARNDPPNWKRWWRALAAKLTSCGQMIFAKFIAEAA